MDSHSYELYASDSSSSRNSATSHESSSVPEKIQVKEKAVEEESPPIPPNPEIPNLPEDLNVGPAESPELNLLNPSNMGSSSSEQRRPESSSRSRTFFSCKYCKKKFTTCMALGGHQNAHRKERALEKWPRDKRRMEVGPLYHPYGSTLSRFGVRMNSLIGKPTHPWSFSQSPSNPSCNFGHNNMMFDRPPPLYNFGLSNNMFDKPPPAYNFEQRQNHMFGRTAAPYDFRLHNNIWQRMEVPVTYDRLRMESLQRETFLPPATPSTFHVGSSSGSVPDQFLGVSESPAPAPDLIMGVSHSPPIPNLMGAVINSANQNDQVLVEDPFGLVNQEEGDPAAGLVNKLDEEDPAAGLVDQEDDNPDGLDLELKL